MGWLHEHEFVEVIKAPFVDQKGVNSTGLPFDVVGIDDSLGVDQVRDHHPDERRQQCGSAGDIVRRSAVANLGMQRMTVRQRDGVAVRSIEAMLDVGGLAVAQCLEEIPMFAGQSTEGREERQDQQRSGHHPRRLMHMVVQMLVARFAEERVEPQPEHVERRDARRQQRNQEQQEVQRIELRVAQRSRQDRVLGMEARKRQDVTVIRVDRKIREIPPELEVHAGDRQASDRDHADQHRQRGDRHLAKQATHLGHLLFVMAAGDHAAGAEEHQRLEERMRDEMKQTRRPAADSQAEHHVAELADRRIGEHFLDVGRDNRNRRRDECGDAADVGNDQQHFGDEHRIETSRQIHTRRDHCRRMHERGDRRWTFHRVGQPRLQRELSTFADAATEDPQACDNQQRVRDRFAFRIGFFSWMPVLVAMLLILE